MNPGIYGNSGARRPAPKRQPALPPFDASDQYGLVHTTCPPDQIIPKGYDRDWFRCDIVGRCLPVAPPAVPGDNGNWNKQMVMSYFLPYYSLPQYGGMKQVDAILTSHAETNYSHFHLDRWNLDNAGLSLKQQMDLIAYVQSWGFFPSFWACGSSDARVGGWPAVQPAIEPFLKALIARGLADKAVCLVGEELNNGISPADCQSIIVGVTDICNPVGMPAWLHFTGFYPGYPPNVPPDQFDAAMVAWIAQWKGKIKGLCWQSEAGVSAGLQGAKLWDARRFWYRADPSFKVSAFELEATDEFNGRCTEEYGCLRGLEMIYCTSDGTAGPVSGFGNGARYPDGTPI